MLRELLASVRRHRLTDPQAWLGRFVIWFAAVGVGLAAVVFAQLFEHVYRIFSGWYARFFWLPLLLAPAVGAAGVWLTRRFFEGAEGSGIPQVIAAGADGINDSGLRRFVSMRIAVGKFFLVLAALGGGFSVGREGPTVQIGAALMVAGRRFLPRTFEVDAKSLLVAGGAAGLAAAFNTPLAGIVFAIEELARRFEQGTNGVLIAAIVWAGIVSLALLGNYTYFGRFYVADVPLSIMPVLLVCGIVCGLAGGLFGRLLLSAFRDMPWVARVRNAHPVLFGGGCGLLVAALGLATAGATFGGGYETTRGMLAGTVAPPWYYTIARFASTWLSTASGLPGGIFAPSLAIGAGIGTDLTPLAPVGVNAAAVTALCMAAYLAAVTHAPLTSFIIVMEMVDGHAMVLSLMAVAMIANVVSRLVGRPLYQTLAERMLARLPDEARQRRVEESL